MGQKYGFSAIFRNVGRPHAKNYYAPSNRQAHKIRAQIAKNPEVTFISGIKAMPNNKLPLIITMGDLPAVRSLKGVKHASP